MPDIQQPTYSVVLPCYNEVGNLEPLARELHAVLGKLEQPYEIIFVDDASTDGTTEKLREMIARDDRLRHIRHRQNFGQSAGILAGFHAARAPIIITMDADLQNDPADIPMMLRTLRKTRAHAVCGVRARRVDSFGKRLSSRLANYFRDRLLGDGIHDAGCAFRVMRRSALGELIHFRALHRFLPTILKWQGRKVVEVPINHRARQSGTSKYGFGNRFFVGIQDILGMRWYRRRLLPPNRIETPPAPDAAKTRR